MPKDRADCGLEGCGSGFATSRFREFGSPQWRLFVSRSGISRSNGAEHTPPKLRGPIWRPFRAVSYTHLTLPTICSV
eukprot:15436288-Alexandrium_andersonii.AAC.1